MLVAVFLPDSPKASEMSAMTMPPCADLILSDDHKTSIVSEPEMLTQTEALKLKTIVEESTTDEGSGVSDCEASSGSDTESDSKEDASKNMALQSADSEEDEILNEQALSLASPEEEPTMAASPMSVLSAEDQVVIAHLASPVSVRSPPGLTRASIRSPPGLSRRSTSRCFRRPAKAEPVDATTLLRASAGRPVKVWLPEAQPLKKLDPNVPAKKRPPFPEFAGKVKSLDPNMPAKKRMPSWLAEFNGDADTTLVKKQTATLINRPVPPVVDPNAPR